MATLTGTRVKDTYDSILKLKDNDSLSTGKKKVTDGLGNETPLSISTTEVELAGDLTVTGDLIVDGTTTSVNSIEVNIGDNIIVLNANEAGTPSQDAGIEIERGTSANTVLRFNETTDRWEFTNDGTTYHRIPITNEFNPTIGIDTNLTTTGATVVDSILITDGVITSHSTRTLTLADLGYTEATGSQWDDVVGGINYADGKVGIGTTNPGGKLTVSNNGAESIEFFPNNFTNGNTIQHYNRTASIYLAAKTIAADHRFNIGTSEAMRIDSSRNVGIGTTSFAGKLSVNESGSGVYFTRQSGDNGTTAPVLAFANDSTKSIIAAAGDGIIFKTRTVGGAAFSGSEKMRITSGGNVGIGKTNPLYKLDVNGSAGIDGNLVVNGILDVFSADGDQFVDSDFATASMTFGDIDAVSFGSTFKIEGNTGNYKWIANGIEKMRLTDGANLHVDGDVIAYSATISDKRLKEDIETISRASETVSKLRGVSYVWSAGSRKGQQEIGLIAQEVEEVLPFLVREHELPLTNGADDNTIYKTVDYEKLVGLLIEDSKEKQERIERLEAMVDIMCKRM